MTVAFERLAYGVGRLASVTYPNGQVTSFDWEAKTGDFRLREITNLGAGNTALSQFEYVTDAVSRILTWKQQRGTESKERLGLEYNAGDELTSAVLKNDATSAIIEAFSYSYDPAGNRLSEQTGTSVTTASYNNLNQLLTRGGKTRFQGTINEPGHVTVAGQAAWMQGATNFTADVPLASGTNNVAIVARDASNNTRTNTYQVITPEPQSITYDVAGNMGSDGTRTYAWDARSRLVKITHADASTSEFTYDALGRRVLIVEKDTAGTVSETRRFIYDGLEEAELRDADNNVIRRYYAEGWRDEPTAANYFLTKDHLGSTREVVDGSGTLATCYTYDPYDPYGRTTQLVGTVESDNLYTGHYRHEKSGLYLTTYRAYSPELARWLSRDPIGEAGGINLYGYVSNNPINLWDPLGLYITYGNGTPEFWDEYRSMFDKMWSTPSAL